MPKDKLHFNVYGHPITLEGPETLLSSAMEKFRDFSAKNTIPAEKAATRIYARLIPPAGPGNAFLFFKTEKYGVYRTKCGFRLIKYGDILSCHCNFKRGIFVINSAEEGHLKELVYLLMLSRFGEFLDGKGIHRLHAAALSLEGRTLAVTGRPGAGKTTLLLNLLKNGKKAKLISDDVVLLDSRLNLYPLPLRISVAENDALSPSFAGSGKISRLDGKNKYSDDKGAFETEKEVKKLEFLLFAEKSGKAGIKKISPPRAFFKLCLPLIIGYGVPQMAEFLLRFNFRDLFRLALVSFSRFAAALSASHGAECYIYLRSENREENDVFIRELLEKTLKIGD